MHSTSPQRNDELHSIQARLVNASWSHLEVYLEPDFPDVVVTNTVLVLKSLVQRQLMNPTEQQNDFPVTVISRLAYLIDDIKHPKSRSCAIWMVGQYACFETAKAGAIEGVSEWAPDVLRRTCKSFAQEVNIIRAHPPASSCPPRNQKSSCKSSAWLQNCSR